MKKFPIGIIINSFRTDIPTSVRKAAECGDGVLDDRRRHSGIGAGAHARALCGDGGVFAADCQRNGAAQSCKGRIRRRTGKMPCPFCLRCDIMNKA